MTSVYRIDEFLNDIDKLTPKKAVSKTDISNAKKRINARCKAEIGYLRKHLTLSSLRRARTDYRNAIRNHYKDKPLLTGFSFNDKSGLTHIAMKYLTLTKNEVKAYKQHETDRKTAYLTGEYRLVITNAADMVNKINDLLDSDSAYDIASGLLLATGRRSVEIFKTGGFKATGNNTVIFSGQAKTRGSKDAKDNYEIFTLVDSSRIVNALAKLRQLKDFSDKTELQVNAAVSNALGKAVKRNFGGYIQSTVNGSIDTLKSFTSIEARNLRPIYIVLSHKIFTPLSVLHSYAENALGHAHKDDSLDNYMEFMLHPSEVL
jgi:hypothetical protein